MNRIDRYRLAGCLLMVASAVLVIALAWALAVVLAIAEVLS